MKKRMCAALALMMVALMLSGCFAKAKVGLVTTPAGVQDNAYSQRIWDELNAYADETRISLEYRVPQSMDIEQLLYEIDMLYAQGYRLIVLPGEGFAEAARQAQSQYDDATLVLMDSLGDYSEGRIAAARFDEAQAGFIAGVGAAAHMKTGTIGMVLKGQSDGDNQYARGFTAGVEYANRSTGGDVSVPEDMTAYIGDAPAKSEGQKLAAYLFDKGCNAVFCNDGQGNIGAITEGKLRAQAGESVWIIGSDWDQYADGLYADGKSVVLTSAVKQVASAMRDMLDKATKKALTPGESYAYGAQTGAVGLPLENPNLDADAEALATQAMNAFGDGSISIP